MCAWQLKSLFSFLSDQLMTNRYFFKVLEPVSVCQEFCGHFVIHLQCSGILQCWLNVHFLALRSSRVESLGSFHGFSGVCPQFWVQPYAYGWPIQKFIKYISNIGIYQRFQSLDGQNISKFSI